MVVTPHGGTFSEGKCPAPWKNMTKKLTCIECPMGCTLSVDIENCKVAKVSGNKCPKGEKYAVSEVETPLRVLTSAVACENLSLKMLPVRTDKAIPKAKLMEGMDEIRKIRVSKPVAAGEVLVKNFLGLDADLIATRTLTGEG